MGCGASKGPEGNAPTPLPIPPAPAVTEFDPDSKPRQEERSDPVEARPTGSREASRQVSNGVKSTVAEPGNVQDLKPGPSTSLRVAAAPALPSPPSTPPVAAPKSQNSSDLTSQSMRKQSSSSSARQGAAASEASLLPTAQEEAAAADAAEYFPVQVALNVGSPVRSMSPPYAQQSPPQPLPVATSLGRANAGGGVVIGRPAALSEATSLQPFDVSEPPSQAASMTALPTARSNRQQQPPVPLREEVEFLPSAIQTQQPQTQQPRQLDGFASGSASVSGRASDPPPPDPNDPWSSLQTQYRIREHAAEEASYGSGAASVRSRAGASRAGGTAPEGGGKEVLVLGDDDEFSGGTKNMMMASIRSNARGPVSLPPAVPPGAQPKKGGWGSGQMAQAGELMIGEDDGWLENDRPPGMSSLAASLPPPRQKGSYGSSSYAARAAEEDDDPHAALMKAPLAKGRPADDVQCEDIEDVDALLEDEMDRHGLSNKSLAAKLAAYESQFDDKD